jgi:hypothetical protein
MKSLIYLRVSVVFLFLVLSGTSLFGQEDSPILKQLDGTIKVLSDQGATGIVESYNFRVTQVIDSNSALIKRGSYDYYFEGSTSGWHDDANYSMHFGLVDRRKSFTTVLGANRTLPVVMAVSPEEVLMNKEYVKTCNEAKRIRLEMLVEKYNKSFYLYEDANGKSKKGYKHKVKPVLKDGRIVFEDKYGNVVSITKSQKTGDSSILAANSKGRMKLADRTVEHVLPILDKVSEILTRYNY